MSDSELRRRSFHGSAADSVMERRHHAGVAFDPQPTSFQRWIYRNRVLLQLGCGAFVVFGVAWAFYQFTSGDGQRGLVGLGIASGFGSSFLLVRLHRPPVE